ncbi:MAG: hypothetical protein IPP79_20630 [Chitinophagaceae bacterium]|nr:hypothetical protein [Chitinophagaceae bacterium]
MKPENNLDSPGQGKASSIRLGVWNRLEPQPRKVDFSQVLSAPTADALWMLTRQWQFGEFTGEDAATSIMAKVIAEFTPVSRLGWDNHVSVFNNDIPLEAQIEGEKVPVDWRTHLQVSAYWKKLLKANEVDATLFQMFIDAFPMTDADWLMSPQREEQDITGDKDLLRQQLFLKNKIFNTTTFIKNLTSPDSNADNVLRNQNILDDSQLAANVLRNQNILDDSQLLEVEKFESNLNLAGDQLLLWLNKLYVVPQGTSTSPWDQSRLEYRFDLASPDADANNPRIAIRSKEYYQGQPDWYAFEIDKTLPEITPLIQNNQLVDELITAETKTITLLSSKSEFPGMPTARLWEFENNMINFGQIDADTTDLSTIILAEFALVASNDWQVVPFNVKSGSISTIKSIIVTDSFGFNTLIDPVDPADKWNFIGLSQKNNGSSVGSDPRLFFPPVTYKTHEGNPIEHIIFIRDEMANMVWAIEKTVPGFMGEGIDAYQAFLRRKAEFLKEVLLKEKLLNAELLAAGEPLPVVVKSDATYSYEFMSTVPEPWIPFVPARIPETDASIRLLRGKLSVIRMAFLST